MRSTLFASWPRRLAALSGLVCGILALFLATGAGAATVTIAPGETLSEIASRHGTTAAQLAASNGIANPNEVLAGSRLRVSGAAAGSGTGAASAGAGYRVRAGDTLSGIAARHGTTAGELARANGISLDGILSIGTQLTVAGGTSQAAAPAATGAPAPATSGSHRVKAGETLSAIGARHGVSANAIAQANGLANADVIVAGDLLSIPGSSAQASAPAATSAPASRSTVASLLDRASSRHGVPADLARAVAWQESGWQQSARSSVGAIGVMQLMPATARWFGPAVMGRSVNPHSVADNVDAGVAYLSYLRRKLGDQRLAIGAYYRGPNAVAKYGLGSETRAYVSSVMALRGTV